MDHRVDVADEGRRHGLRARLLRPRRRIARHLLVRVALHHVRALELVHGEVLRSALHGLVARGAEEAGDAEPLGDVLLVVPAVELRFLVRGHVAPHHQESGSSRVRHDYPSPSGFAGSGYARLVGALASNGLQRPSPLPISRTAGSTSLPISRMHVRVSFSLTKPDRKSTRM